MSHQEEMDGDSPGMGHYALPGFSQSMTTDCRCYHHVESFPPWNKRLADIIVSVLFEIC